MIHAGTGIGDFVDGSKDAIDGFQYGEGLYPGVSGEGVRPFIPSYYDVKDVLAGVINPGVEVCLGDTVVYSVAF